MKRLATFIRGVGIFLGVVVGLAGTLLLGGPLGGVIAGGLVVASALFLAWLIDFFSRPAQ